MTWQINDKRTTYEVIKRVSGQTNVLTIPRIYIDITKNIKSALFLSQCIYWADKMGRSFYKSYKDWEDEIGLSRWDIDNARKECKGIITTELRKANGSPTLHYTVDWDKLYEEIGSLANGFARNSQMDLLETSKSLTEITTETTNNISAQKILQEEPLPTGKENKPRAKEDIIKSTEDALFRSLTSTKSDYANYPERIAPVVERMVKYWNFKAPSRKNGQYAFWVESCAQILDACAEFGVELLDKLHKDWELYLDNNRGIAPYPISSPKSLYSAVCGKAAMLRGGNETPFWIVKNIGRKSKLDI